MIRLMTYWAVLALSVAFAPPSASAQSPQDTRYVELASSIEAHALDSGFNGVVRVSRGGEVIYEGAFGQEIAGGAQDFDQQTPFVIASITKLFTATLVMQEVEAGRIELDAPLSRYLPGVSGSEDPEVSVHQLLNHTSGLPTCYSGQFQGPAPIYQVEATPQALIERFCSRARSAPLGEQFFYNNGDYLRLGLILEAVTGQSFDALLRERILRPLNLSGTQLITDYVVDEYAAAYTWDEEAQAFERGPNIRLENYHASGGMTSTARDLQRFSDALFAGELLSEDALELILRTHPESRGYGYGVWVRYPTYNRTVPRVMERYGKIWGHNSLLAHFIEDDITVVVLANTDRVFVGDFQTLTGRTLLD